MPSERRDTASAAYTDLARAVFPLPAPVDEITFRERDEIETMTLRSGRWLVKQPYTITDCFRVGYAPSNSPFGAGRPLRVLDSALLTAKRTQMFSIAYDTLVREMAAA